MGEVGVLVVLAAMAGAFTWLVVKGRDIARQRDFDRSVHARKLGWTYDGKRDGRIDYRFAGDADGIAWKMWHDSDRGDNSPTPCAYWASANLQTPALALVIIGQRRYRLESGLIGQMLMGVVSGVAQATVGGEARSDKPEFYQTAVELKSGRPGFHERFAVLVTPDMPRGWIDDELQSLLLAWPEAVAVRAFSSEDCVEVSLRAGGLQIVAQRMPQQFACWEHLAKLGVHLAQRLSPLSAR